MSLLNLLKVSEERKIDAAWRRYAELLERGEGDTKVVAELEQCMALLGKTATDAEADLRLLKQARNQGEHIEQGSNLDSKRVAARQTAEKYHAETARIVEERRRKLLDMQTIASDLESLHSRGEQATNTLRSLKDQHPKLLEHIPAVQTT